MKLLSTTALSGPYPTMLPWQSVVFDPASSTISGPDDIHSFRRSVRSDIVPQPYGNPHPADWLDWGFKRRGRAFIGGEWRDIEVTP